MTKNDIEWLKTIIQAYGLAESLSLYSAACSALSLEMAPEDAHTANRLMSAAVQLDAISCEYEDYEARRLSG